MDREQVIYKLKQAIESGKLQEFKNECYERINLCDDYIKVWYI